MRYKRPIQSLVGIAVAVTASIGFAQIPGVAANVGLQPVLLKPWSGPAGSPEAARDTGIAYMSALTGIPKDSLTAELEAVDANSATVAVAAPNNGQSCHYQMLKKTEQNAFGWEIQNSACTRG